MIKLDAILKLLPPFLQQDPSAQGFLAALQHQINKLQQQDLNRQLYQNTITMQDNVLDSLAWQFNVAGYQNKMSIEEKSRLITNSIAVSQHLGTVYSVKSVLRDTLGAAKLYEWFEYGGKPYHFKIVLEPGNVIYDGEKTRKALELIRAYKNLRSVMENVTLKFDFELSAPNLITAPAVTIAYPLSEGNGSTTHTILLDGSHRLDGSWIFSSTTDTGPTLCRITILAQFYNPSTLTGTVVVDDVWRLDGTYLLDGTRLLNASDDKEMI